MATEARTPGGIVVRQVRWPQAAPILRRIRRAVFVEEQGIPAELEWDGRDAGCIHVLARDASGAAVGTVRMTPDGHVGRMAVLATHRRRGIGGALLHHLLELARRAGLETVHLNAQAAAVAFYRRHGFAPRGEVFLEAGIPHRVMSRRL